MSARLPVVVASDLDRTLVYSAAAMRLGEPVADPVCVEVYDGAASGFVAPETLSGLVALAERAWFVPVTTRTQAQYARIVLPGVAVAHAVTTNGAVLLVDGVPCPDWDREVGARLAASASFAEATRALAPVWDRPWVTKVRDAEERFAYAVLDLPALDLDEGGPGAWYAEVAAVADRLGWRTSVQGRKIYVLPAALTKEAAVAEVVRRTGAAGCLAAGDSLLDAGMLLAAGPGRAVRPAHGELHEPGHAPAGVAVTAASGGRAGAEIVAWLADRVDEVAPAGTGDGGDPEPGAALAGLDGAHAG